MYCKCDIIALAATCDDDVIRDERVNNCEAPTHRRDARQTSLKNGIIARVFFNIIVSNHVYNIADVKEHIVFAFTCPQPEQNRFVGTVVLPINGNVRTASFLRVLLQTDKNVIFSTKQKLRASLQHTNQLIKNYKYFVVRRLIYDTCMMWYIIGGELRLARCR